MKKAHIASIVILMMGLAACSEGFCVIPGFQPDPHIVCYIHHQVILQFSGNLSFTAHTNSRRGSRVSIIASTPK